MNAQHHYRLTVKWTGNTGTGTSNYKEFERSRTIFVHNKTDILSSSDPAFRGDTFGRHNKFMVFGAAICCKAKAFIKQQIRAVFNRRNTQVSLQSTAVKLNPKIRGWLNYYCSFNPGAAGKVFLYLNELIRRWIEEKYRLRSKKAVVLQYQSYVGENTDLFIHWRKGIIY